LRKEKITSTKKEMSQTTDTDNKRFKSKLKIT